jgi:hypothetical protein
LERYRLGSVLNGGNTSPNKNQYASADEWKELSKAFYELLSRWTFLSRERGRFQRLE